MSSRSRNVIVGIVVLIGLGVTVWMVLLFAGRMANLFASPGLPLSMKSTRADGVSEGSAIYYLGVQTGRVTSVTRSADNQSVVITGQVNKQPPLPANLHAVIQPQSAFGMAATISLELTGPPSGNLEPGAELQASYAPASLLPPEVTQVAEEMQRQHLIQHLDQTVVSIREQSERAGQLLQSVQQIVGDPKLRNDLQSALASIRTASDAAAKTGKNLETFTGNLQHISDQTSNTMSDVRVAAVRLGTVLDHFESVAQKVDQGKGTAGLLVNDPRLYQGLVDTTKELNATVADLQRVVQQWEQEGVTLKLGK